MNDWAIVVSVDHYPASANWTLRGAVCDAIGMRDWLLSPHGANIAPDHLTLLLAPVPGAPAPTVNFTEATHDRDVDLMLAAIDGDTSALKAALDAGVNLDITDGQLLQRYAHLLREI